MRIPPSFRTAIIGCIQGAFNAATLQALSMKYPMGISFEDSRRLDENFLDASETFVDDVIGRGYLDALIRAIIGERSQLESAVQLSQTYNTIFTVENNKLKYQPELFKKEVLAQKTTLFISRYSVSELLNQMVNQDIINRLGLMGEKETGVSYVNLYMSELEAEFNCFKFLYLDLKKIRNDPATQNPVEAADIAQLIAARLNMNFTGHQNFKVTIFGQTLQNRLDELAAESEKWLFFIDQLDESDHPDVKSLVRELAIVASRRPQTFFFLFDAYNDWENDFESNNLFETPSLELKPFTLDEVKKYLDNLYENKEMDFKILNKPTYDATVAATLNGNLFAPSDKSNVPAVSKELRSWFRGTKATVEKLKKEKKP